MTVSRTRSFGELLRTYRVRAGLTQEELAERARMSLAAIGKLERGARQRPYRPTIALLADALSLSADDRLELERAGRTAASPAASEQGPSVKLPAYLSSFIGREQDIAAICEMLATHRLVTLVGAAGVGKTRLAVRAAERFVSTTAGEKLDGVWFADFSSIDDAKMIAMALASGIGIDGCTTVEAAVSYLRSQSFLLVLDNCEHLLDPIATAANEIVAGSPGARILATSRQALSLDGERIYQVPPLSLPDAIALFKDRAEAIDSRFTLTDAVTAAVTDICQRVDGVALGIELAAARTNAFSPASIAQQIAEHFQLLAGGIRTSAPRHQTIGSLFDWSYDLLDDAEQELFRRSSVFAGGFTLNLVSALYAEDAERRAVPLVLASLVDKSLIQSDITVEPTRYRLLEPARQYAQEKLRDRGEHDQAGRAHARALLALAEGFDSRLALVSDVEWDNAIERERDNFRAAFEFSFGPRGDTIVGLQLAGSKTATWGGFKSGEIRRLMNVALAACNDNTPPRVRAKFAMGVARTAVIYGYSWQPGSDPEDRLNACRSALSAQLPDDRRAVATAQLWVGIELQTTGRYDEAETVLREARATFSSLGVESEYCSATTTLGSVRFGAGDLIEARELISESLRLCEDAGSNRVAADARAALAEIEFASGNAENAVRLGDETSNFFRSRSNFNALPMSLGNTSAYLVALGRYDEAREAALENLHWSYAMRNAHSAFWAMQHLAAIVVLGGDASDRSLLRRAAAVLGFVDASTQHRDIPRYHTEQQEYDKMLASLSTVFGPAELQDLMTAGKTLSEERALAEAIAISE